MNRARYRWIEVQRQRTAYRRQLRRLALRWMLGAIVSFAGFLALLALFGSR